MLTLGAAADPSSRLLDDTIHLVAQRSRQPSLSRSQHRYSSRRHLRRRSGRTCALSALPSRAPDWRTGCRSPPSVLLRERGMRYAYYQHHRAAAR